jgi:3-dehydroquinate synthetase/3-dehydroquinate dehydratase/shikimate kinase
MTDRIVGSEARVDFDADAPAAARIVLVGFMGAGKTSLARRWATSGGPSLWFDSDAVALRHLRATSVQDVIDGEDGWARFRDAERIVVEERAGSLARGVEVWSLGGGALQHDSVRAALEDACVVWLDAPVDVLWERVAGTDRPLARDYDAFCELYAERRSTYESIATVRVDTSGDPDAIGLGRVLAEHMPSNWFASGLVVGDGLLGRVDDLAALCSGKVAVVCDEAVADYARAVRDRLEGAGVEIMAHTELAMGEWNKQLSTVERLLVDWAEHRVHRTATIVAIGGGTLLDTAGFAASIYQRGVDWVCIPTTLTSQVDAGIGGKTGVNLGVTKNMIGTVHMPRATLIDTALVDDLPEDALRDGFVEAAKTALLAGGWLFDRVEAVVAARHDEQSVRHARWLELIEGCAGYKDIVVSEDPFDTDGIRAQLNLGHTLAHGIEAATGGAVSHGAAVAIGTHAALRLSAFLFEQDEQLVERWLDLCMSMGVVTTSPLSWSVVEPYLALDKKRDDQGIGWVLVEGVGAPVTNARIPLELVQRTWEEHVHVDHHHGSAGRALIEAASVRHPRVLVLFGVNLGQLGQRDQEHYGSATLGELVRDIEAWASAEGLIADCRQTDDLTRFLHALHEAGTRHHAVIVNPGAWTHHEYAIHDALEPLPMPRVEVHLSDIAAREEWRAESVIRPVVDHVVSGRGADGYRDALHWVRERLSTPTP